MFGLKTLSSGFEVLFLHLDTHNRKNPCFLIDVDFLSLLKLWIYLYLIYAIKVQVLEVFPLIQCTFSSCSCICVMKIKIKRPYIFSSLIWAGVYPAGWEGPDQQVLLCCCRRGLLWCFDKSLPGHFPLHGDAVRLKGSERLWAMVNWVSWSWLTDL